MQRPKIFLATRVRLVRGIDVIRHRRLLATMSKTLDADAKQHTVVDPGELKRFVVRCMTKVGTSEHQASSLADVLVAADARGHFSHGLNRLEMYVHDIESGICNSERDPVVLKETAATAWVDGNNVLGPAVGNFCMNLAIRKAKEAGIGWIVAKGSNHYGIAGFYSMQTLKHGMIGMSFTNTSPLQVPTRGKQAVLGTNPLSVAAPALEADESFVLDMATSTAAIGKVELHDRKGITIPNSWGVDKDGKETLEPKEVLVGGGLLPLGGMETTGGYKGYGLATMVEIFCGILAGAHYGTDVRRWMNTTREADLGQCFVAIDPSAFAPDFPTRMSGLIKQCKTASKAEGEDEILIAGDPERRAEQKVKDEGGIRYHPNQITHMFELAKKLNVEPMMIR